jgi:hypothetical protein
MNTSVKDAIRSNQSLAMHSTQLVHPALFTVLGEGELDSSK